MDQPEAFGNEPANRIHWLAIVVLLLGLVATVTVTAMRRPLDLFRSSLRPFSITKTDALAIASILAIAGGVALFVLRPLPSSYSFGIFPVLMLSTSVLIFGLAGIFSRSSSPVAILSLALAVALLLQVSDRFLPSRDFRHSGISIDKTPAPKSVEGVKAKRQVPPLKLCLQAVAGA